MRGKPEQQLAMLTSLSTEDLIPADHPIRRIRKVIEGVLAELDGEFDVMYSRIGRPSVPPEQLLKATVLMALYSVRSERAFCERLNYDLLFKWFLDLPIDAPPSTSRRSPRTGSACSATRSPTASSPPWSARPSSAATSRPSTSPWTAPCSGPGLTQELGDQGRLAAPPAHRAGATAVDFRGGPRNTRTHRSTTDPEALLARRVRRVTGQGLLRGAHPHGDRSAPIVDMELTQADGVGQTGRGRPDAAQAPRAQAATDVAADKACDTAASWPDVG